MKQLFYKLIYQPQVNFLLRNINKSLLPIMPIKVKLPPSGKMVMYDSKNQKIKLYTNQTNYLTHLLYWEGGAMNFEYTSIFLALIRRMQCFYDIGANIGYYSLLAAAENKDIHVVGFEPATGPLYYFKKNVQANRFKNIQIESVALAEREGELVFYEIKNKKYTYLEHNLAGESNAGSKTKGKNFVKVNVKATTLDRFAKKNNHAIDLIKMDTEGTEHLILQQGSEVLEHYKPIVICETLFNAIEPELEKVMKVHNYLFFNHVADGLQQVDTIIRNQDNGVRNCFFVHPSKLTLIQDFIIK